MASAQIEMRTPQELKCLVITAIGVAVAAFGCGTKKAQSNLIGTWAWDPAPRQTIQFTFKTNHAYTMFVGGTAGLLGGTWDLKGPMLSLVVTSFAAYGMTNGLTTPPNLIPPKITVLHIGNSSMIWSGGIFGNNAELTRVSAPPNQ